MQGSPVGRNARLPPDDRILFRVGLNTGEVVVQSDRVGGTTVNVMAALAGRLAVASGVSDTEITLIFDHEHDFDVGLRPRLPNDWAC